MNRYGLLSVRSPLPTVIDRYRSGVVEVRKSLRDRGRWRPRPSDTVGRLSGRLFRGAAGVKNAFPLSPLKSAPLSPSLALCGAMSLRFSLWA